jgi:small subunit ribosomal protein S9
MKIVNTSGKRKRATAKATVRAGSGAITVNNIPLEMYAPRYVQMKLAEPVILLGDAIKHVNIDISVRGGGINGQAEAARIALSRGVVEFTKDEDLKAKLLAYDRQLLVADVRRKEKSKPNCHGKARSKVQKSYR